MDGNWHCASCEHSPARCLASPDISLGLLSLFPQARSTVWMLLPNGLSVRQVLGPVDNSDEHANLWAIDAHVGIDAGGVLLQGNRLCCGHGGDVDLDTP